MKLTTKGRYAVTAVIDIAIYSSTLPVSLSELSARQEISVAYLEQLAAKLRAAKILRSVRGAKGGYVLAQDKHAITVAQIIDAIEGNVDATRCKGKQNCKSTGSCLTHDLWSDLNKVINDFLSKVTIEQLVKKHNQSRIKKTGVIRANTEDYLQPQRINLKQVVAFAE